MNVTYGELYTALPALRELSQQPMAIGVALRVDRILARVESEMEIFRKRYVEILEKYGSEVEPGNYRVDDANKEAFDKDLAEMQAESITLDVPGVPEKDLGGVEISPVAARTISWMLT